MRDADRKTMSDFDVGVGNFRENNKNIILLGYSENLDLCFRNKLLGQICKT